MISKHPTTSDINPKKFKKLKRKFGDAFDATKVNARPRLSKSATSQRPEYLSRLADIDLESVVWKIIHASTTEKKSEVLRVLSVPENRFCQVIDKATGGTAILRYSDIVPDPQLCAATKKFAPTSKLLGTWRRSHPHMHKTADTRDLSNFSLKHEVMDDIKKYSNLLQQFQKRHLPVLHKSQERIRRLLKAHLDAVKNNPSKFETTAPLSIEQFDIDVSYLGNFSMVGIGHKSSRTAKSHTDSKNDVYGYSCVMVFGDFQGGFFYFPDLGIEMEVKPGDLIVFDAATYRHRITKVDGERYSLIFFNCRNMVGELMAENGLRPELFRKGLGVHPDGYLRAGLTRYFDPTVAGQN